MNTIVCIKQVPETTEIGWNPSTGTLIREGVPGVLNPSDKHALEAALRLRERYGGQIAALSMGPLQAEEVLREALSMGVDEAILVSDGIFAGADTLSTAYALSLAVRRIGRFDLILCGKESYDGRTGQVGPQLAELLNIPQLTYAIEIAVTNKKVRIKQKLEGGFRVVESFFPALITVEKEMNQPRIPTMESIIEAYGSKEVQVWGAEDLGGKRERLGLKGSPTQTRKVYTKELRRGKVTILEGEPDEVASKLIQTLRAKGLL